MCNDDEKTLPDEEDGQKEPIVEEIGNVGDTGASDDEPPVPRSRRSRRPPAPTLDIESRYQAHLEKVKSGGK